jgi:hypothetical protein
MASYCIKLWLDFASMECCLENHVFAIETVVPLTSLYFLLLCTAWLKCAIFSSIVLTKSAGKKRHCSQFLQAVE